MSKTYPMRSVWLVRDAFIHLPGLVRAQNRTKTDLKDTSKMSVWLVWAGDTSAEATCARNRACKRDLMRSLLESEEQTLAATQVCGRSLRHARIIENDRLQKVLGGLAWLAVSRDAHGVTLFGFH